MGAQIWREGGLRDPEEGPLGSVGSGEHISYWARLAEAMDPAEVCWSNYAPRSVL